MPSLSRACLHMYRAIRSQLTQQWEVYIFSQISQNSIPSCSLSHLQRPPHLGRFYRCSRSRNPEIRLRVILRARNKASGLCSHSGTLPRAYSSLPMHQVYISKILADTSVKVLHVFLLPHYAPTAALHNPIHVQNRFIQHRP